MGNILDLGGNEQVDVATVGAGDDEFQDGDGSSTNIYNDSGAGSTNSVTFLRTDLARVDEVMVGVQTDDTGEAVGTISASAVPAQDAIADDLDGLGDDEEYGLVRLVLRDTSDGTELGDDTNVSNLEVTYTAIRT